MGTIAEVAAGAVSGLGNIGLGIYDRHKANERYEEQKTYERNLQERLFQREDSAYQRAVADARKAGLSPLAALGTSAGQAGAAVDNSASQGYASQVHDASMQIGQGFQQAASAALQTRALNAQVRSLEAKADVDQKRANAYVSSVRGSLITNAGYLALAADKNERERGIYSHNINYARDNNSPYGATPTTLNEVLGAINDFVQSKEDSKNPIMRTTTSTLKAIKDYITESGPGAQIGQKIVDAFSTKSSLTSEQFFGVLSGLYGEDSRIQQDSDGVKINGKSMSAKDIYKDWRSAQYAYLDTLDESLRNPHIPSSEKSRIQQLKDDVEYNLNHTKESDIRAALKEYL